jgi:hypothetical protein
VIHLAGVLTPITFSREIEGSMRDLIVPEDFVKDFHLSSAEHLMIIIRVTGTDSPKVKDFFEDSEEQLFSIKTVESEHEKEISDEFILSSMYMDEGPPLSVDINAEIPMVRLILDFKMQF